MTAASGRRPLPLLVQPAFVIILIVATVHVVRGAPADAVLTYAVAAALLVEQLWLRGRADRRAPAGLTPAARWPLAEAAAVLVVAAAFGSLAGRWELYDWRLKVATAVPGLLVALLIFTRRPPEPAAVSLARPAPHGWLWPAVGVAICLQELASFVQQPDPQTGSDAHPTVSYLLEPLLQSPLVRGCVLAGWLIAGYYLVRRAGLLRRAR